jgi:hypothetical protein
VTVGIDKISQVGLRLSDAVRELADQDRSSGKTRSGRWDCDFCVRGLRGDQGGSEETRSARWECDRSAPLTADPVRKNRRATPGRSQDRGSPHRRSRLCCAWIRRQCRPPGSTAVLPGREVGPRSWAAHTLPIQTVLSYYIVDDRLHPSRTDPLRLRRHGCSIRSPGATWSRPISGRSIARSAPGTLLALEATRFEGVTAKRCPAH